MARPKKQDSSEGGLPEWMATYSDLVTLLLTFFVLLFSMASLDTELFQAVSASIRSSFSVLDMSDMMNERTADQIFSVFDATNATEDRPVPEPGSKEYEKFVEEILIENAQLKAEVEDLSNANEFTLTEEEKLQWELADIRAKKLENFREEILNEIDRMGIAGYVSIVDEKEKLVLRLASQILFDSGSATIKPEGRTVLGELGGSLSELDHHIEVQGHTDNRPINTAQFPSNWELSNQRATNVVRFLQDQSGVMPNRLRSTGFGEYQPIGDNATDEGRQANRRIDIVITD